MKRYISIFIAVAMVMILIVSMFAVNGADMTVTYYLNANGEKLDSAVAYYSFGMDSSFSPITMTECEQDGLYSVDIPSDAMRIYFLYTSESVTLNSEAYSIAELSGNMYNIDDETWSNYGSNQPSNSTATINVVGKIAEGNNVVSVDINWGAMEFTYNKGTWDPVNHEYVNSTGEAWTAEGNTITVTNHSNVDVTASFEFVKADNTNIIGMFRDAQDQPVSSIDLASADSISSEATSTGSVSFHITDGSIERDMSSLGTITVIVTKRTQ